MATGRRPRRGSTTASLLTGSAGSRPAATPAASALSASSPWSYSPAPESRDVAQIRSRYGLFIDGKERAPFGGEVTITFNPATEEPLAEIAKGTPEDADRAIEAASRAYRKVWSRLHPRERAKYLYRISRILQERSREFAVTETLDSGKPIRESRDVDVPLAAAHFWYYAGWADKLAYAVPGRRPESHGVVGQVIPWNFPLLMLAWKIAPALAAGNTVVLKPASTTPLTALLFADICRQAGLPDGVVDRKSTRLNSSHMSESRMPSSA